MIFAAGLGTRLKPLTDAMPKALVTVGGIPMLQIQIKRLKAAGITDIVINVHHFATQIVQFVAKHDSFGTNIMFSPEIKQLLDTGGGIKHAAPLLLPNSQNTDEYFLVHNVDILSNLDLKRFINLAQASAQLLAATQESESIPLAFLLVSERKTIRYLLFDDSMRLVGWTNINTGEVRSPYPNLRVEKCRKFAFAGIHLLSTSVFPLMQSWPEKFSIIDFYLDVCATHSILGVSIPDLRLMDVGKFYMLDQADTFMKDIDD